MLAFRKSFPMKDPYRIVFSSGSFARRHRRSDRDVGASSNISAGPMVSVDSFSATPLPKIELVKAGGRPRARRRYGMAVAKNLVLFLRRSGRQAQFSQVLKRQEGEPTRLRDVSAFIFEHLNEPLPLERLARNVGMSVRTLTRWCRQELGESPAALVRRVRIEEAQRLLEQTPLPLKDIAARSQFGDASTLWRIFTRYLGVTPADYRARFAACVAKG
jgi:transcriptional regulator GlxA family with amidase domain